MRRGLSAAEAEGSGRQKAATARRDVYLCPLFFIISTYHLEKNCMEDTRLAFFKQSESVQVVSDKKKLFFRVCI